MVQNSACEAAPGRRVSLAARLALALIRRYQALGGGQALFGVACNFTPTCSEYTRLSILRLGFRRGCLLGWQRIRRCNQRGLIHPIADPAPCCDTGCTRHSQDKAE